MDFYDSVVSDCLLLTLMEINAISDSHMKLYVKDQIPSPAPTQAGQKKSSLMLGHQCRRCSMKAASHQNRLWWPFCVSAHEERLKKSMQIIWLPPPPLRRKLRQSGVLCHSQRAGLHPSIRFPSLPRRVTPVSLPGGPPQGGGQT